MSCPICHKDSVTACRPFCSQRCADIDLGRWMNGTYKVETEELPGSDTGPEPDPETQH